MTDDVLDLLSQRYADRPAVDLTWRDLLAVRDAVDRVLNAEINRRQLEDLPGDGNGLARRPAARPARKPLTRRKLQPDDVRAKAGSASSPRAQIRLRLLAAPRFLLRGSRGAARNPRERHAP